MVDGNHDENNQNIVHLPPREVTASVHFPMPWDRPLTKIKKDLEKNKNLSNFQLMLPMQGLYTSKLQGRSIQNLVISTWNYRGN